MEADSRLTLYLTILSSGLVDFIKTISDYRAFTVCQRLYMGHLISLTEQPLCSNAFMSISLLMKKARYRQVKWLIQGHGADKGPGGEAELWRFVPEPLHPVTLLRLPHYACLHHFLLRCLQNFLEGISATFHSATI